MGSHFSSVKNFLILFVIVITVLTLGLTGPFGYVLASSNYGQVFFQSFGTLGSGSGEFTSPAGIEVAANGTIYVSDTENDRVEVFNASGIYQNQIVSLGSGGSFYSPRGIATDSSGNLYVADTFNHRIVKLSSSGSFIKSWGQNGTGDGSFIEPYDVAVDKTNNVLYVADNRNNRVQKFDLNGGFQAKWGGTAAGSGNDQFNRPSGVAVDSYGYVYVADTNNNRVKKVSSTGTLLGIIGSYGTGNGQFNQPRGIAIDSENTLYVLDTGNNRVQKLTSSGTFVAKWGAYGSGSAQFSAPYAIAARSMDSVLVADTTNNRVQVFEPDQLPSFIAISSTTVLENQPAGTQVGTLTTTDGNAHDTFSYALVTDCASTDNSSFAINGDKLVTAVPLSLQTKADYYVCVRVTDSGGMTNYRPFTVTVENVNDPPVLEENQTFPPLSEAALNGTVVGQIIAVDPDKGESLTFTKIGGTGAGALDVNTNGQVVVANSSLLDFETLNHLTLDVKVTDLSGLSDTGTINLYLTDANDAPIPVSFTASIPENSPRETLIGTGLTYSDQDLPAQSMTWDIIGYQPADVNNSIMFKVIDNGWVTYTKHTTIQNPILNVINTGAFNYEYYPVITLTIRVTDNGFPARYNDFTVTVNVTDVNEPPECGGRYEVSMLENPVLGKTFSDSIRIYDPEKAIEEWKIVSGDPDHNFDLVPQKSPYPNDIYSWAALTVTKENVPLNYEVEQPYFDLEIDVRDSGQFTCKDSPYKPEKVNLRVYIANVEEPVTLSADAFNPITPLVDEYTLDGPNPNVNDVVSVVHAADPDMYGTYNPGFWYEIIDGNPGPNNNKLFKMVNNWLQTSPYNEGIIALNNPSLLDYETAPSYVLKVRVWDRRGFTAMENITISVKDKNDRPQINHQTFFANTADPENTELGQVVATDQDKIDTHTFELVSVTRTSGTGTGNPFSMGNDGTILIATPGNMVDGDVFTLHVRATDNGTPPLSGEGDVTVSVSSGNNPPIIEDQSFYVDENTAASTVVYYIAARDHEGDNISYSIVDPVGQDTFTITGVDARKYGILAVSNPSMLDYESTTATGHKLTLKVRATDNGIPNKYKDATITVYINDVNEAPSIEDKVFHINENPEAGMVVGLLGATDPDLGTVLSYSFILDSNPGETFEVTTNGELKVLKPDLLDHETLTGPINLTIMVADDGSPKLTKDASFTVIVDDINEPAVVEPASFTVDENSPAGTLVGTVKALDQDVPANHLIYTITAGNSNNIFAIDDSGKITVSKNYSLNYESTKSYTLTVEVLDDTPQPAISAPVTIPVAVNNIDEAPELEIGVQNLSIDDRSPQGQFVGKVKATDPETSPVSFEIVGGNTNNAFEIQPDPILKDTAVITVKTASAIDYGKTPLFNLSIAASDGSKSSLAHVNVFLITYPDLALTVKAPRGVIAGTHIKIVAQVKNTGYKASDAYTLTLAVPDGLTFDTSNSWYECDLTGPGTVTCTGKPMKDQSSLGYEVSFIADPSLADNTQLPMSINISPTGDDMDSTNNTWVGAITGWRNTIRLYDETFNSSPDLASFWKVDGTAAPNVATAPSGEKFIGQFSGDKLTYESGPLSEHTSVTVSFDLYIIGGWSGNDLADGPDQWQINVGGQNLTTALWKQRMSAAGQVLINTTFSNRSGIYQAFPGQYPGGNNHAFAGSTAKNMLKYSPDTTYHMTYTFNHSEPTLSLNFLDTLPKPGAKSWGIDNVKITLTNAAGNYLVFLPSLHR